MSLHFEARRQRTIEAQVRATANAPSFLASVGIKDRRGRDYRCPRCGDFRLVAYAADGGVGHTFTCHKCSTGKLDGIGLYRWLHSASFTEAREWLMSVAGLADDGALTPSPTRTLMPCAEQVPSSVTLEAFRVGANVLLSVARPLTLSSAAGSYMANRHMFDVAVDAGLMHLGCDSKEVAQAARWARDSVGEAAAVASGIWSQGNALSYGYARFPHASHSLVIPWLDGGGKVSAIRRRAIGPVAGEVSKYMTTRGAPVPPLPFMHRSDVRDAHGERFRSVVICEGELDALMLRAHGEQAGHLPSGALVVAVGGASMVGRFRSVASWRELLSGREAVLAFDADRAGVEAAQRLGAILREQGHKVTTLRPPTGKDWGEALGAA